MPSRAHNKLIERIENLNKVPDDPKEYENWIKADGHLALLRDNEKEEELILYGANRYTFIHSAVVSLDCLDPVDQDDLLKWSGNPYSSSASYLSGSEQDGIWIELDTNWGAKTLGSARQLVFARHFKGMKGSEASYYEVLQEYLHLTDIHWRPERRAYCRFDESGEFDHVVSITSNGDGGSVTLVSFKREPLEQYLAASNSVLIRMFVFSLLRPERVFDVPDWSHQPKTLNEANKLLYRFNIEPGKESHTRGVQIIHLSRPKSEIISSMRDSWFEDDKGPYVEFIAHDYRNKCIARISTDPDVSTNYFQAGENSLPFETSPAFFSPEVLHKYKADEDKYSVEGGMISCRSAWELRTYDVNEEGQVHTYICYLRDLPYKEQLYWLSFNEKPKTGISQRAIETDFLAEFPSVAEPLDEVAHVIRAWIESGASWWKLRDRALLERVSMPRTTSRKEWAEAFSSLSMLVIEGFQVKAIRVRLAEMGIAFDKEEKSLSLIEKFLIGRCELGVDERLNGLREVHLIRSKVSAHSGGSDAVTLANNALQEHETYTAHFESVCKTVAEELKLIEQAFS